MLGQILRGGTQQVFNHKQLTPHQPRGRLVGNAQAQVNVVIDQVNIAIFQNQLHINPGIAPQKLGHMRVNHIAAHRFGHADPDQPFGLLGKAPAQIHHRLRCARHLKAALEHFFAPLAQAQLARGALQQTDGKGFFQPRNTAAYR